MTTAEDETYLANLRAKLVRTVSLLSQDIDFKGLEESGLLKKIGAWYRTPSVKTLPDHVALRIQEIKFAEGSTLVKLEKITVIRKMATRLGLETRDFAAPAAPLPEIAG
jgi:hypothetical protein